VRHTKETGLPTKTKNGWLQLPGSVDVEDSTRFETVVGTNTTTYLRQIPVEEMDCVTIKLVERDTGLPLDIIISINSFLYEKLTNENFEAAIALWFEDEEKCKWRFGHISFWNTSRVTNMIESFAMRENFNDDLRRWNVSNVTNMMYMFCGAIQLNRPEPMECQQS
jgi:hypothetical protein